MVVGGARAGVGGKTWVAPKIKDMDEKKGKHDLRAILQVCFLWGFLGRCRLVRFLHSFILGFAFLFKLWNRAIKASVISGPNGLTLEIQPKDHNVKCKQTGRKKNIYHELGSDIFSNWQINLININSEKCLGAWYGDEGQLIFTSMTFF